MSTSIALISLSICQMNNAIALDPLLLKKGELVYARDFDDGKPLDKNRWQEVQHSRWSVKNGKAVGQPSSNESRKKIIQEQIAAGKGERAGRSHMGDLARLHIKKIPDPAIMEIKFKMVGGNDRDSRYHRVIEFRVHGARIQFAVNKTLMLADHDKLVLKEDPWVLPDDTWCHMLAEIRGDELIFQIEGGPTLRGKHPSYLRDKPMLINLFGKQEGEVHIDYIKFWKGE